MVLTASQLRLIWEAAARRLNLIVISSLRCSYKIMRPRTPPLFAVLRWKFSAGADGKKQIYVPTRGSTTVVCRHSEFLWRVPTEGNWLLDEVASPSSCLLRRSSRNLGTGEVTAIAGGLARKIDECKTRARSNQNRSRDLSPGR
jgi:hypothetical protein